MTEDKSKIVIHQDCLVLGGSKLPAGTYVKQKEWVGLTDEEKAWCGAPTLQETVARVEAKLKEKNT